jgi:hypothetical protein
MNFMKNSSKMEKGTSLKWSRQASLREKDLGSNLAKVSLGNERGFKILPGQQCQNVIAQTVGWENPDPIHEMAIIVGESTHCHLR